MEDIIYHGSALTSESRFDEAKGIIEACLPQNILEGVSFISPSESDKEPPKYVRNVLVSGYGSPLDYRQNKNVTGYTSYWNHLSNDTTIAGAQIFLNHCYYSRQAMSGLRCNGHEVALFDSELDDSVVLLLDVVFISLFARGGSCLDVYLAGFKILEEIGAGIGSPKFADIILSYYAFVERAAPRLSEYFLFDDRYVRPSIFQNMFAGHDLFKKNVTINNSRLHGKLAHSIVVMREDSVVRREYEKAVNQLAELVGPVFGSGRSVWRNNVRIPEERSVEVLVASDRVYDGTDWTNDAADGLSYGISMVHIPSGYRMGNRPWIQVARRVELAPRMYVNEKRKASLNEALAFIKSLSSSETPTVLCYVHGFNTSLDEALVKAAQIRYDLGLVFPMVAFSWPSLGSLRHYVADMHRADISARYFADLLRQLSILGPQTRLAVIAHSMGTKVVVNGLQALKQSQDISLSELILVASDIDKRNVDTYESALRNLVDRSTVYASSCDSVLRVSAVIGREQRLGHLPPPAVRDYYDLIDVSSAVDGFLRHDYHLREPSVIFDIHSAIQGAHTSTRRLRKEKDAQPRHYHLLG